MFCPKCGGKIPDNMEKTDEDGIESQIHCWDCGIDFMVINETKRQEIIRKNYPHLFERNPLYEKALNDLRKR